MHEPLDPGALPSARPAAAPHNGLPGRLLVLTAIVAASVLATTAFAARTVGRSEPTTISVQRLVLTDSTGKAGAVFELHGQVLRIWLPQVSDSGRPTGIELAPAPSLAVTKRGETVYEIIPKNGYVRPVMDRAR
jgi:hypothetical protein